MSKKNRILAVTPLLVGQICIDAVIVAVSFYAAYAFRFDNVLPPKYRILMLSSYPYVVPIKLAIFYLNGLYSRWWRYTSLSDSWRLIWTNLLASTAATFVVYLMSESYRQPRSVPLLDLLICAVGMLAVRFIVRSLYQWPQGQDGRRQKPVLIIGAGDAGELIVREMRRNSNLGHTPVGMLDDDPRKRGMHINGVKVLGTTKDLIEVCEEFDVEEVIIAMPTAPGAAIKDMVYRCEKAGIDCKTLPGVFELIKGTVSVNQLREVQVEDILGREEIEVDLKEIASYLEGKRVMVTGAGGSIGSELCRQIALIGPADLILLDHAEDNLFNIEQEIIGTGFDRISAVIADVKEKDRMEGIFQRLKPQVIFHAAAYKHVPLMQHNQSESIANNSMATSLLAAMAGRHGVERFVLISTDKAVDAQTAMGRSKALAERAVEALADGGEFDTRYMIVRFGNVLGSSGSVVPIFKRQIAAGGPVTVTHPEMTRFFMTIPEAVRLVIQAGAIGTGGEIFVLDMGHPVKIIDLARNMIELTGHDPDTDIEIKITGVRPGEKIHEILFNQDEEVATTSHPKIRLARRQPVDRSFIDAGLSSLAIIIAEGREADIEPAVVKLLAAVAAEVEPA